MATKDALNPMRLSRIDFYRCRGFDFFQYLFTTIDRELGEGERRLKRWPKLNPLAQGVYAWWIFQGELENGGLVQFFYNKGDAFVSAIETILRESGNGTLIPSLKQATRIYRRRKKEFDVEQPFGEGGLFSRMTQFDKMDRAFGRSFARTDRQLEKWLRANISRFAVADGGEPIDPNFTGEIETRHPNGKVFEQAAVRRGVLSGPYRRFLANGTLEQSSYYEAGEISANYWPNGQPKHRTMKRGKLQIDEWYFPSGSLQKRYVSDKSGFTVEPIRVWHDNGQLAEIIHEKNGRKIGPWLKYFEDGSPKLQAEYRKNELLVIKNAWNDQGLQIVKNGRGTIRDDAYDFDASYELKSENSWIRERELRDGIPHGAGRTWSDGKLWSRENYADGKLDGEHLTFYDNGRLRSRAIYRNGRERKSEDFPKFDNPRPAVLIRVEADDKLYEAWKHPLLTEYPAPRNLETIQARLRIPAFLHEIFARNQTNSLADEYEDFNTFDESIGYFVMLNERGGVDKVEFTGCGAYSGGTVNDYIPFIKKLRFKPGHLKGRKVCCRIFVEVAHTFVETPK